MYTAFNIEWLLREIIQYIRVVVEKEHFSDQTPYRGILFAGYAVE